MNLENLKNMNFKNINFKYLEELKKHFFLSQPHQPFFILAFVNAIISMFLFMLFFKAIIVTDFSAKNFHAYSLIYLMFTPAFLAFLFTTFPRFSGVPAIPQKHYLPVFGLFLAGSILFLLGALFSNGIAILGMVVVFIAHIGAGNILLSIYNASPMYENEKTDQYWILVAIGAGVFANFLFILSSWFPSLHTLSIQISIYLYLFLVTFTVGQRMIPFFSHTPIEKHMERFRVIVGLLGLHVLLETIQPNSSFLADFLLAYLIGKELHRWKLPFPNPNPLVWILHIGLFWIPVSFALSGITNLISLSSGLNFLYLDIHMLLLGFIFTLLIGFGTRVTIGHSGNQMKADRLTTMLFYWTQVVIVVRILTSLALVNGWNFFVFFDISITVWLVMFGVWGYRFFAVLIFGKKLDEM
ncbi:MAG: NnrS family protein, partial [Sulfurovaceae bacterium]|nr:NnrS family protein [Sulfurovaceae bacterium]